MAQVAQTMPLSGDKRVPVFDPTQPRTLSRYWANLEALFAQHTVGDVQEKKRFSQLYVPIDIADDWEGLPESAAASDWDTYKAAVTRLYPGADATARYTRATLQHLITTAKQRGIQTLGDWAEFFRSYSTQSKWLIKETKISEIDQKQWCADAIGSRHMSQIQTRLTLKHPDVHPSDGYPLAALDEAMRFHLHDTALTPSSTIAQVTRGAPTTVAGGTPMIKTEDFNRMLELLARIAPSSTAPIQLTSSNSAPRAAPDPSTGCHYCSAASHGIGNCPAAEEDIRAGKCKRNVEGKLVLPSGAFVPRTIPGNCMRDRVNEWHRNNPNQVARGTLSYALEDGDYAPTGSMLFEVSNGATMQGNATTYTFTNPDMERIQALEREIYALRSQRERVKFDGVLMPPRRTRGKATETAPQEAPKERAEEADEDAEDPPRNLARAPTPPPAPPVPAVPEHPFARAPDATYLPPAQRNVGAAPPKEAREPTYRNKALIEDPKIVERVLERTLRASNLTITPEELLAISPDIRSKMRELINTKRVPVDKDKPTLSLYNEAGPVLPALEELVSRVQLPRGILRVADPYEIYLNRLAPGETPRKLTVARESHALCTVTAAVGERESTIDCLLDPGSQVVSCSEGVCHALTLTYDPSITLNMQSANGDIDQTLGLARNVPFRVGDITVYLQVHVVRHAAYDILMGRPFDVLTASIVRNYNNADQTITIHCPNSGRISTVPTLARGRPKYQMEPEDF